jgi:hypothetical protein
MKFILINGRRPRLQSSCALCGEPIGETYLREIPNPALSYCDYRCYLSAFETCRPQATQIPLCAVMSLSW